MVDWILGPGEKLLGSQTEIGNSYRTADDLRKQHEQLELKCAVSDGGEPYLVIGTTGIAFLLYGVCCGLVVSVLDCQSRSSGVQLPVRAEIWFEISAPPGKMRL